MSNTILEFLDHLFDQNIPEKFICDICGKEFKNARALRSHKNHHDPEYHEKSKKGGLSTVKKASEVRTKNMNIARENATTKYYENPKLCKFCQTIISYKSRANEFCNRMCKSLYQKNKNRSKESIEKQIKSLKETLSKKDKPIKPKELKSCLVCNTFHTKSGKTCSKECAQILSKESFKKRIEAGYNPQKHRGRHKKSYLETSFEDWLIKNNFSSYITEYQIKRYKNTGEYKNSYFIDFYFPEKQVGIELDGTQHKETKDYDLERDIYISETHNIQIYRISHEEYIKKTKVDFIIKLLS